MQDVNIYSYKENAEVGLIFKNSICKLKEIYPLSITQEQSNCYECKNIGEQECIRLAH